MRVLVTGHRGYIGSVLTGVLRNARYEVVGLDCDYYRGCEFGRVSDPVACFDTDVRDVEFTDLLSFDAVIHLADLPEAAASTFNPALTRQINEEAAMRLAACCKKADVRRFVFASTCVLDGSAVADVLADPLSRSSMRRHAESKLRCEMSIARLADRSFVPVFARCGSVYGVSPSLRLDLPVNDFVAAAVTTGHIRLETDGSELRPLVHVEDLARVYAAMLVAPDEVVAGRVFEILAPDENLRTVDVADTVAELVPETSRVTLPSAPRVAGCTADGDLFRRTFPEFGFRWTLEMGVRQLRTALESVGLSPGDWRCDRFRRLLRLSRLVEHGDVDVTLRCHDTVAAA